MSRITLVIEDKGWRAHRGLQGQVKLAADAARKAAGLKGGFTILLASDKKLRALNREFRGKDKPTNVLSFPRAGDYAGDIALAYGVTKKKPRTQARRSPIMPLIWWYTGCFILPAMITSGPRMRA